MSTERFDAVLRDAGFRRTPQRQQVWETVERLRHATPEQIASALTAVDLSTVYRALDVLVEVGLITHTHIGHGPPVYHAVDPTPHLHLVCQRCGRQESADIGLAAGLAADVHTRHGFTADLAYMSLPGVCRDCAAEAAQA